MTSLLKALPAKARLYAYAALGVLALVVAAIQAADGDWLQAAGLFLGSLGFGTAGANVTTGTVVDDTPALDEPTDTNN